MQQTLCVFLQTRRKYESCHKTKVFYCRRKIRNQNHRGTNRVFAERQWDRFMGNVVLFDKDGAPVARMQSEFKKVFTSWFSISDSRGNEVCCINEKLPFLCFRRAESSHGNLKVKIKAGPFHMKAYLLNEQGKTLAVKARKKILAIRDTYIIDIDESKINPAYGVLVGVWYDLVCHPSH